MSVSDWSTHLFKALILVLFLGISLYFVPYHEHWADEAQAFLVARDASWIDILTKIPHQEGQPTLWHLLLKICINIFGKEVNISYISVGVMFIVVCLIVYNYDIPIIYKALLPFGFYFLYQHNIVARNYCLSYLALTIMGLLYHKRRRHPYLYAFSLIFLAETTIFYSFVAFLFGLKWIYEERHQLKDILFPLILLGTGGCLLLWQIFPLTSEHDKSFYYFRFSVVCERIVEAFCGWTNWVYILLFAIVIGVYLGSSNLWRTIYKNLPALFFSLICFLPFCLMSIAIHHTGLIFGLFLFLCYILSSQNTRKKHHFVLLTIFIMQIYQSIIFLTYDKMFYYNALPYVVETLKMKAFFSQKIYTIGYYTIPLFMYDSALHFEHIDSSAYYNWEKKACKNYRILADILIISEDAISCDYSYLDSQYKKLSFINPCIRGIHDHPLTLYIKKDLL